MHEYYFVTLLSLVDDITGDKLSKFLCDKEFELNKSPPPNNPVIPPANAKYGLIIAPALPRACDAICLPKISFPKLREAFNV